MNCMLLSEFVGWL